MVRRLISSIVVLALGMLVTWIAMPPSPISSSLGTTDPQTKLHVVGDRIRLENQGKLLDRSADRDGLDVTAAVSAQSPDGHSLDAADGDPTDAVFVDNDGNVGIGTTGPRTQFHVLGRISTGAEGASPGSITFFLQDGRGWFHIDNGPASNRTIGRLRISGGVNPGDLEMVSILDNGNVGIGTSSPEAMLDVAGYNRLGAGIADSWFPYWGDGWAYVSGKGIVFREDAAGEYAERMRIADNGNVDIGTTDPQHKLSVKGTVQSTEVVVVAPQDFPDFVFEDGYNLMTLAELEKYINQHGYLPGIPSAEEVDEKGLHVGEMQAQLLQKMEELTLYVIDLKKENEALKERMEAMGK
jgi:hypothetical protein